MALLHDAYDAQCEDFLCLYFKQASTLSFLMMQLKAYVIFLSY